MKKYFLLFVILCGVIFFAAFVNFDSASATTGSFTIIALPDTQYYNGSNSWIFKDQVDWIIANKEALNIQMVVGLGDIIDGGGYPVDGNGNVIGTCTTAPDSNWRTQWQEAQAQVSSLRANGIYFQPTIGNHDYDCEANRPQPRSATNYFYYMGTPEFSPTAYILNSAGERTPNFYKNLTINGQSYMIMSLEFFPDATIVSKANALISAHKGPVILATHAYLSFDGSGPNFMGTTPPGSAFPLCSGFPSSIYNCQADSLASYNPPGGTDGFGLWTNVVSQHSNLFMVLSGHIRNPSPGNYPSVPDYNGVGYVDCNNTQPWSSICSTPNRPIQMVSDYQGQGNNGYFGYGYLRIIQVNPTTKNVSVSTYSPAIADSPSLFPSGIPAHKTDTHNKFTIPFPNTFGGPDHDVIQMSTPKDGSKVSSTFAISAKASGPHPVNHLQIYVDSVLYKDYPNTSVLPSGTSIVLTRFKTHRLVVQGFDTVTQAWVKTAVYVTN